MLNYRNLTLFWRILFFETYNKWFKKFAILSIDNSINNDYSYDQIISVDFYFKDDGLMGSFPNRETFFSKLLIRLFKTL